MSKHTVTVQKGWLNGHFFEELELGIAVKRAELPGNDPIFITPGRSNVMVALDVDEHHGVYVDLMGDSDNVKTISRAIEVLREVRNALEQAERRED